MCGIVGYVGKRDVVDVLLGGLENLEYRGYDSAGIALNDENQIKVWRAVGKLHNLGEMLCGRKSEIVAPSGGIGHVRWATHGAPTVENAHPHMSNSGHIAVVHNGIIENFQELKSKLLAVGCVFHSQTDSEVIAHLVDTEYEQVGDLQVAVANTIKQLRGVFAIAVIHQDCPDVIIVARKGAPLIIGLGNDENFVASDMAALIKYTQKVIFLNNMELAVVTAKEVQVFDVDGAPVYQEIKTLDIAPTEISKHGYPHFMLKEIHEQPDIIRNMLHDKIDDKNSVIAFPELKMSESELQKILRIEIVACGTSLHAGMIVRHVIEELCGISVDVRAASEYIYSRHLTDKNTLFIGISQSGETADTLTAVGQAKSCGAHILIITNNANSAMARMAHSLIVTPAGIEVSVAATKSFTAQLMALYMFALFLGQKTDAAAQDKISDILHALRQIPTQMEQILDNTDQVKKCAQRFADTVNFIYIARGINLAIAYEGALKLKEISYINASGYAAGELKHGPIALLDENVTVLSIMMNDAVYDKMFSNAQEVAARHAHLIALTSSGDEKLGDLFDIVLRIPQTHALLSPILSVVPLQLLAYYIADIRGRDIDKPRNLAKSVTVE